MSIYGNYITEGFFLSSEGKEMKKKLQEICKSTQVKKSLKEKLMTKYDKQIMKKTLDRITKNFDKIHIGPVTILTITSSSGAASETYYLVITGISKNSVYNFKLNLMCDRCSIYTLDEKKIDTFIYPKDIVEFTLDNMNSQYIVEFNKNSIKITTLISKFAMGYKDNPIIAKISSYLNTKYPDINYKAKGDKITFSK